VYSRPQSLIEASGQPSVHAQYVTTGKGGLCTSGRPWDFIFSRRQVWRWLSSGMLGRDDRRSRISETSVKFYQTTRRNIPENKHLHWRRSRLASEPAWTWWRRGKFNTRNRWWTRSWRLLWVTLVMELSCLMITVYCACLKPGWFSYSVWLRTGRPGFDPWQRQRIFLEPLHPHRLWAHPASCAMGTGGKARPGRDADHSLPSSAEVKNE
jgi:hypothetical protein